MEHGQHLNRSVNMINARADGVRYRYVHVIVRYDSANMNSFHIYLCRFAWR